MSPAMQAHSLLPEPPGKLRYNVSAMEIDEMSGKFKLSFLEYHGIFFPNIFQRVDCIFFSPNIKFLAMATHSSENPRDGGAWWAAVYGVTQSWTRLKQLSSKAITAWGKRVLYLYNHAACS